MIIVIIIAIIVAAISIIYFAIAYFIAGTVIHLNRQPVPKNPSNYGMSFTNLDFRTSDGVNIKGWLIPGSANKLVIMTHVGGLTKYGSMASYKNVTKLYNNEIEFLKTAEHLHREGYWILTFDLRNHGESGPDPKGVAGIGLKEYLDVVAAMKYVNETKELREMNVGFVSFCMGANSTIIAMSKTPEVFQNTKCLFAVQPISMEVFIRTYARKLLGRAVANILLPMVSKFVYLRGGVPLAEMSPKKFVKNLRVPTMYVQARNDPWTVMSDIEGFYQETPDNPKEFFWIEGTRHRFESYSYFQTSPEKMLEWLKRWM